MPLCIDSGFVAGKNRENQVFLLHVWPWREQLQQKLAVAVPYRHRAQKTPAEKLAVAASYANDKENTCRRIGGSYKVWFSFWGKSSCWVFEFLLRRQSSCWEDIFLMSLLSGASLAVVFLNSCLGVSLPVGRTFS